jgi:hypothetical protein
MDTSKGSEGEEKVRSGDYQHRALRRSQQEGIIWKKRYANYAISAEYLLILFDPGGRIFHKVLTHPSTVSVYNREFVSGLVHGLDVAF